MPPFDRIPVGVNTPVQSKLVLNKSVAYASRSPCMAKTVLQGAVMGARSKKKGKTQESVGSEDNVREWTAGLDFPEQSQRTVRGRRTEMGGQLVAKPPMGCP